jgi:hypothetical protein
VIALLVLAAAASGASDAGSIRTLHDLGECVVSQTPRAARDVLALDYRAANYQQRLKSVGERSGRCMARASRLESSGILFAGSIAEAFLKRDWTSKRLASQISDDQTLPIVEVRSPLEEMALCTVRRAPRDTVALFRTLPATPGESATVTSLAPVLGECMAKGTKAELNKPAIRSLLALAAYRIVTAPKVAAR